MLGPLIPRFLVLSGLTSQRAEDPEKARQCVPDETQIADDISVDDELFEDDQEENNDSSQPEERHSSGIRHPHRVTSLYSLRVSPSNAVTGKRPWLSSLKALLNPPATTGDFESSMPNYRHTPIISGILIPFSILLEVPGLTEKWYIRTNENTIVESQKNPVILDVGIAFSIACAVIANACLVIRFLEKKVKLMTVLCIVFLIIHDVINVVAVTTFGVLHRFDDGFTYGQSFWMTVCSTICSTLTTVTLLFDLNRTTGFKNSGSGLTQKQRDVVVIVIVLLCYIAFGALIHTFLLDLHFIDALYFTISSIETIGFGDIVPQSTAARVFVCLYSALGIVNLALAVGLIRETVLEGLEFSYRRRIKAARERRKFTQRKRRVTERWRAAIEWRLREAHQPTWVEDTEDLCQVTLPRRLLNRFWPWSSGYRNCPRGIEHFGSDHPHRIHLNLEALTRAQLEAAALEVGVSLHTLLPAGFEKYFVSGDKGATRNVGTDRPRQLKPGSGDLPLTHARLGRMAVMLRNFACAIHKTPVSIKTNTEASAKVQGARSSTEIHLNRRSSNQDHSIQEGLESEERHAFFGRLTVAWLLFIAFWLVGSAVFMRTEGWGYGTAMYFCFVAFATLGYGDYTVQTPVGRSIFVVWALLGVGTMTILISIISEAYTYRYKRVIHSSVFRHAVERYEGRIRVISKKYRERRRNFNLPPPPIPTEPRAPDIHSSLLYPRVLPEHCLQEQLEALPHHILRRTRALDDHVHYLMQPGHRFDEKMEMRYIPDGLQRLVCEIVGDDRLGESIRQEILQDKDARRILLALSIERELRRMVDIAEAAIEALARRDTSNIEHELR